MGVAGKQLKDRLLIVESSAVGVNFEISTVVVVAAAVEISWGKAAITTSDRCRATTTFSRSNCREP